MKVTLKWAGYYRKNFPGKDFLEIEFDEKAKENDPDLSNEKSAFNIRSLVESCGLNPNEVGFAVIEGVMCRLDTELHGGEIVMIYPEIIGG
jgi:hypothetical protein